MTTANSPRVHALRIVTILEWFRCGDVTAEWYEAEFRRLWSLVPADMFSEVSARIRVAVGRGTRSDFAALDDPR